MSGKCRSYAALFRVELRDFVVLLRDAPRVSIERVRVVSASLLVDPPVEAFTPSDTPSRACRRIGPFANFATVLGELCGLRGLAIMNPLSSLSSLAGLWQITVEPILGQVCHRLQSARLFKQMRSAWNNFEILLGWN